MIRELEILEKKVKKRFAEWNKASTFALPKRKMVLKAGKVEGIEGDVKREDLYD